MPPRLNAAFLELEHSRSLLRDAPSLEELHQIINQLMREVLTYSKASSEERNTQKTHGDSWLDTVLETLANICIELLNERNTSRERLLTLVDRALIQWEGHPSQTVH
jgi:hypothetical protein